jgi:hypothetical protein
VTGSCRGRLLSFRNRGYNYFVLYRGGRTLLELERLDPEVSVALTRRWGHRIRLMLECWDTLGSSMALSRFLVGRRPIVASQTVDLQLARSFKFEGLVAAYATPLPRLRFVASTAAAFLRCPRPVRLKRASSDRCLSC